MTEVLRTLFICAAAMDRLSENMPETKACFVKKAASEIKSIIAKLETYNESI